MGNKWLLHILNTSTQFWKDMFIKSWIGIAPAFNGSPKVLKTLLSGDDFGIPLISNFKVFYIILIN